MLTPQTTTTMILSFSIGWMLAKIAPNIKAKYREYMRSRGESAYSSLQEAKDSFEKELDGYDPNTDQSQLGHRFSALKYRPKATKTRKRRYYSPKKKATD